MSVPDLFRKQGALASLRPANVQQLGSKQQPAEEERPQLLQRLETCLQQARIAGVSLAQHNSSWGAKKMELDAHRQAFDMFISSVTTYRPLLLRIKQAYEAALLDAIASAYDHVHLQTELSQMPHKHADTVAAARQQAEQSAAAMLDELQSKLQELQRQAVQAEQECTETEDQSRNYLRHILQARKEQDQLDASNRRSYKELVENSSWAVLAQMAVQGQQGSHVGRAYRTSGGVS